MNRARTTEPDHDELHILAMIIPLIVLILIGLIPNLLALVFSGLFTWDRGCGALQALG